MSDGGPTTPAAQYGKVIAEAWREPAFKAS